MYSQGAGMGEEGQGAGVVAIYNIYILKSNVCVCLCVGVFVFVSQIHGHTVGPILPKFWIGSSFSEGPVIKG